MNEDPEKLEFVSSGTFLTPRVPDELLDDFVDFLRDGLERYPDMSPDELAERHPVLFKSWPVKKDETDA